MYLRNCFLSVVTICLILCTQNISAQSVENEEEEPFTTEDVSGFHKSKIHVGGGFGMSFGDLVAIELSPRVGYRLTPKIELGVGFSYHYVNFRNPPPGYVPYKTHVFGGTSYLKAIVYDRLFLFAEAPVVNAEVYNERAFAYERQTLGNLLIGGGYDLYISQKSYLSFTVLYNLIENDLYPIRRPVIGMTLGFGL